MTTDRVAFGVGVGELFRRGVTGLRSRPWPLLATAAATLGTYLAFRIPAQLAFDQGRLLASVLIDLAGLTVAGVVALPWYAVSLAVARGEEPRLAGQLVPSRLTAQAVASIWFWAGVLVGMRYLFGLPALAFLVLYAFHGFSVADGATSGLRALGSSVRLGEGRRVGVFAVGFLFLLFNLAAAIALGTGVDPLTITVTALALLVTTNVTMVAGAHLYTVLEEGRA